jgi:hypothetical protein
MQDKKPRVALGVVEVSKVSINVAAVIPIPGTRKKEDAVVDRFQTLPAQFGRDGVKVTQSYA